MAHLLPARGNYPQFIGVVGFMASFLQAKLRGKEKQTKHGKKQITRQEMLHK